MTGPRPTPDAAPPGPPPAVPPLSPGDATPQPSHMEEWGRLLAAPEGPGEIGRLGGYHVVRVLGAGGMGIVFQAEDPQLKRPVALKIMKPTAAASPEARQRFLREARAVAAVANDHVVAIYQVGEDRGVPFLAMEFLEGETLEDRLREPGQGPAGRRLPTAEILRVGREIAEGLAAAHDRGLVHRDVKPANVWLERRDGRVKLVDFGLARACQEDVQLTQAGMVVGTPAYMSPEQAQSEAVGPQSDLFSLGVVLYLLCTGRLPFRGETAFETLLAVTTETPPVVAHLSPDCPAALARLVEQLLAKRPADRPATAQAVAEAIRAVESGADRTELLAPATVRRPGRNRTRWAVVGLLAAAAAAGAPLLFNPGPAPPAAKAQLHLEEVPEGAAVLLDGKPVAAMAVRRGVEVSPGRHRLVVRRAGSRPAAEEFDAPAGEVVSRSVKLVVLVTDDWVKEVSEARGAVQLRRTKEMLQRLNPEFDPDNVKEEYTKETAAGVHFLRTLAFPADAVSDLSPLRGLTNLRQLDCAGSGPGKGQVTDLAPLANLKLRRLNVKGNPVVDLSPLEQLPELQDLEFDPAPGQDWAVLRRMQKAGALRTVNGQPVAAFLGGK